MSNNKKNSNIGSHKNINSTPHKATTSTTRPKPATKSTVAATRHEHSVRKVDGQGLYTCDGCKMDGRGPRHRCDKCNFDLHKECLFARPTTYVQGHKCQFHRKPLTVPGHKSQFPRSCDACGITVKGFVYHCKEMGWDFHPRCAKLQREIRVHRDVVFRLDKQAGTSKCQWCQKKLLKGANKKIPGWTYVTNTNNYSFHVYCLMDMGMQSSSSSSNMALIKKPELSLQAKSTSSSSSSNKWLKIVFNVFLKTVLSILVGNPTPLLASALEILFT